MNKVEASDLTSIGQDNDANRQSCMMMKNIGCTDALVGLRSQLS